MTRREKITKKIRFEVFKRDGFCCSYCGNTPPAVVLEIDHIEPLSMGGDNDINNLTTSCFNCNRGKAATPLDKIPPKLIENLEFLREKESQIQEYRKFMENIVNRRESDIDLIEKIFSDFYKDKHEFSEKFRKTSMKQFLSLLPFDKVEDAMWSTVVKMGKMDTVTPNRFINYFCGVCWRKIKGDMRY